MEDKYSDLITQTFDFPQEGFEVNENKLNFNDIPLMDVIKQYGTPLKITYLPKISAQIQKAKKLFNVAMAKADYKGKYTYCYCTKSSHFSHILEEVLKNDAHIETSSAFDMPIIKSLYNKKKITKDTYIINNGYKRPRYIKFIGDLVNYGFKNVIPILDNKRELPLLEKACKKKFNVGIRVATDEEPRFEFYTSRLGIRQADIKQYYIDHIKENKKCDLKMLHFFINTGIKDTTYYWSELTKCINVYCDLKEVCPTLDSLDIGGGFPFRSSLAADYDYGYMTDEIVQKIKNICEERGVEEPHLFTEFGSYTVAESGATLYSVIDIKEQNDNELWYMIDSSFITTLPDTWGIKQKFILLAVNHWDKEYQRVNLGGLTCDSEDYYNAETHANQVFMPVVAQKEKEPLYLGFFHTAAYQEALGGYGGIQHCLIPSPKHVIIDQDEEGELTTRLFAKEQSYKSMMKTLGY